jgi:putative hemolysin
MDIGLEAVVILLLILVNGLFSMGEMALVSARKARLAAMERRGIGGSREARALAEDPQRFLPTVQVGITLVGVLTGVFGGARIALQLQTWLLETWPGMAGAAETVALGLVVLVTTYLTLVLGELVPKQLALRQPEAMAVLVARPIGALARATSPVVWLLGRSSDLILRLLGLHRVPQQMVSDEELKALLAEGTRTGQLEIEERDMIERVLRLADKPVRAIMTPRNELAWIDRASPPDDIAAALKSSPHSRFVVCDRSIDNVVGVVQAKDILDRLLSGGVVSIGAALRQPIIIPDTVTALDALERLKADTLGLALVMDEYGSFEGLVTAADVLEAIVGDSADAEPQPAPGALGVDSTLVVDGMMPVDELKARLALPDLPAEGSYHTLAGLILALLRRVPRTGDRLVFGGWRFEVLEMDARRVERVRISREPVAEPPVAKRANAEPTAS